MIARTLARIPRDLPRRVNALLALGFFLLGTNFCVFAPPPALSAPLPSAFASAPEGSPHGCCAAAADRAAREAEATRQATAPCCVAVAPVLAAHGATVDPAPVLAVATELAPLAIPFVSPALARPALPEDARPPALHSATPDAGRAPPRL